MMKKLLSVLAVAAMLASIWACKPTSGKETPDSTAKPNTDISGKADETSEAKEDKKSEEPPLKEKAIEIIEYYYKLRNYNHCAPEEVLEILELTTDEKITNAWAKGKDKLPDGREYGHTDVLYADYEKVMMKHVTKELFEKIFMNGFAVVDDMLVQTSFGATGYEYEVDELDYLGDKSGEFQYEVKGTYGWKRDDDPTKWDEENVDKFNGLITIVLSGGNYVIAEDSDIS